VCPEEASEPATVRTHAITTNLFKFLYGVLTDRRMLVEGAF
jgi:hypothetical protein